MSLSSKSIPSSNLKLLVKQILSVYPECRDCDIKLTEKIWQHCKPELTPQIHTLYLSLQLKELPFSDSITRARRLAQKEDPELRGDKWRQRQHLSNEYRKYLGGKR